MDSNVGPTRGGASFPFTLFLFSLTNWRRPDRIAGGRHHDVSKLPKRCHVSLYRPPPGVFVLLASFSSLLSSLLSLSCTYAVTQERFFRFLFLQLFRQQQFFPWSRFRGYLGFSTVCTVEDSKGSDILLLAVRGPVVSPPMESWSNERPKDIRRTMFRQKDQRHGRRHLPSYSSSVRSRGFHRTLRNEGALAPPNKLDHLLETGTTFVSRNEWESCVPCDDEGSGVHTPRGARGEERRR